MQDFKDKKNRYLSRDLRSQVGVNVPNATIIIIEGGERFGLAQLHQLRCRVIRGTHQVIAIFYADAKRINCREIKGY